MTLGVVGPRTTIINQGETGSLTAETAIVAAELTLRFVGPDLERETYMYVYMCVHVKEQSWT